MLRYILFWEGLITGGLEGLTAGCFCRCFFGSSRGSVLTAAGIGGLSFTAVLFPGFGQAAALFSACWMILAAGIYRAGQRQELFLAGGMWLMICIAAGLWPGSVPLQTVSGLALLGMLLLYLVDRGEFSPLWAGMLAGIWLLAGFLESMDYGEVWQEQVMKMSGYGVLGGMLLFQQIFRLRRQIRREEREPDGAWKRRKKEETAEESGPGAAGNWKEAAAQEYRRLQIFEHDFRHHLDMLGALYEEGNPEEARAYLEDLRQARQSGGGRKSGGERELSYIMMAKKSPCRKAEIQFSYQILGSPQGIAQMDMTALLLNLLDNAIRACEKMPKPRSIGMMLLARGDIWQIELVNTGRILPEGEESADRAQTKAPVHGIGLISVRQIVEKYQGVFEMRQEGDTVVQKIILTGR